MDRCHLKGATDDRLHAVLCAAGYNIKWLLRMIARKGITFAVMIFLCLQQASSQGRPWLASVMVQTLRTAKLWMSGRRPLTSIAGWVLTCRSPLEMNISGPT